MKRPKHRCTTRVPRSSRLYKCPPRLPLFAFIFLPNTFQLAAVLTRRSTYLSPLSSSRPTISTSSFPCPSDGRVRCSPRRLVNPVSSITGHYWLMSLHHQRAVFRCALPVLASYHLVDSPPPNRATFTVLSLLRSS